MGGGVVCQGTAYFPRGGTGLECVYTAWLQGLQTGRVHWYLWADHRCHKTACDSLLCATQHFSLIQVTERTTRCLVISSYSNATVR